MKTKHITLRENKALIELSHYANKSIDDLTEHILTYLFKENVLCDSKDECGETLEAMLYERGNTLQDFAVCCFNVCTPRIIEILKGVQIWGKDYECTECGCTMEYDHYGDYKECTNDVCGCSVKVNCIPDPDANRDCQRNLTKSINLN